MSGQVLHPAVEALASSGGLRPALPKVAAEAEDILGQRHPILE
jgi:hypothetical protein